MNALTGFAAVLPGPSRAGETLPERRPSRRKRGLDLRWWCWVLRWRSGLVHPGRWCLCNRVSGRSSGPVRPGGPVCVKVIGRVPRRTSLDELPQLWNVIRGEMSLVGPCPALPEKVAANPAPALERLAVLPGITGAWQVAGRANLGFDEIVALDATYARHAVLATGLAILCKTVRAVASGRGAIRSVQGHAVAADRPAGAHRDGQRRGQAAHGLHQLVFAIARIAADVVGQKGRVKAHLAGFDHLDPVPPTHGLILRMAQELRAQGRLARFEARYFGADFGKFIGR